MGIETLAALTAAAEAGTVAAVAAPTVAAGTTAATAAGTALGAAETAALAGTAAAETGGAALAGGSLEFANAVGSIGGDALGALVSANQGFGTMSAMESVQGMLASVQASPIVEGLQAADKAASVQPQQQAKPYNGPTAGDPGRVNQNAALTQQSSLMQRTNNQESDLANLDTIGYADGGRVSDSQSWFPDNIFARTRDSREEQAGLQPQPQSQQQPQGITINIGNAGDQKQEGRVPRSEAQTPSMGQLANSIMKLISGFQDGGRIRTGSSDVRAGGEIRGPESKDGRDNQIIKVAGGEGILPKDVMDVPGVADLVQSLIQTYHTPIRK